VIKHMFSNIDFARFAGVRTQAMLESEWYAKVDAAHGGAVSAMATAETADHPMETDHAAQAEPHNAPTTLVDADVPDEDESLYEVCDSDPSDEVMTGDGDSLCLLFGLFVDGVQLHVSGRSTTTVLSLKCLDLPGFLVCSKVASYNLAFIDGPKEPTCMTDFMMMVLAEFKKCEPSTDKDGANIHARTVHAITHSALSTVNTAGNVMLRGEPIEVWDPHRQRHRRVVPLLVAAFADTPARRAWALTTGHTCRSGCDKCGLRSTRLLPDGTGINFSAFLGYAALTNALVYDETTKV